MAPRLRVRVAFDATPLIGRRTGVGAFCAGARRSRAAGEAVAGAAFAIPGRGRHRLAGVVPPGVAVVDRAMPAAALQWCWARWPFPPAEALVGRPDVVHGTNFVVPPARRAATVVSVHDLTPLRFPEWCQPAALAYPRLVKRAVQRGAWVHTDSSFVAGEVIELLGAPAERVRVVPLGVRPPVPAGPPRLLPAWVEGYVLALGTVEPRKGLPTLVEAFGMVAGRHPGLALVVAGPDGWGSAELAGAVSACPARERVVRLGWVDQAARDALLAGARIFAYPSRYEGFGLPPLEAMAAGVPVVATRAGSLEEVLGSAAQLVEAGDAAQLAGAIDSLVSDEAQREKLALRGRERAAQFSWEACAAGLAGLYRDASVSR